MRHLVLVIPFLALFILFHILSANIGGQLANFSPFVAIFFCGAAFWKRSKLLLPIGLIAWVITAPIVSSIKGYPPEISGILVPLLAFAGVAGLGFALSGRSSGTLLLGAVGGGVFFHHFTCVYSFFTSGLYAKTWIGFSEALWTIPSVPGLDLPSSFFLRQTCASSVLFTALFLLAAKIPIFEQKTSSLPQAARSSN